MDLKSFLGRVFYARFLAGDFLAGTWTLDGMVRRATRHTRQPPQWLRSLAQRVLTAFPDPSSKPDRQTLGVWIEADRGFRQAWGRHGCQLSFRRYRHVRPTMHPAAGPPQTWSVPELTAPPALADWLGLTLGELDWFADCQGLEARSPSGPLRHYTYRWVPKRSARWRLLEMPKKRLKAIQRRLLHEILDHIPAHDAVHGFRRGRSIASYVSPHSGKAVVLHFDLRDFFPSVQRSHVYALFRTAGYPHAVARLLTGLCTNVVPGDIGQLRSRADFRDYYRTPHLSQGAPTSPALANLCAYRLDCRLAGLAHVVGARYTRYADDLTFSGDDRLERCARRFQVYVCRIALEEGFEINTRKSRFMRRGVRQQVAGIVLNAHPNIRRVDYDRLKAILTNCVRHGPAAQNRAGVADFRGYLCGKIAFVNMVSAERGQRLHELFDRIRW
jgi:hypothetical protein